MRDLTRIDQPPDDPCIEAMTNGTEEGQKVSRQSGNKYPAVFRRIADKALA